MDAQIHQILQDSGNAKGVTVEDSFFLLALKNPSILKNFEGRLQQEVDAGKLPAEKMNTVMAEIANLSAQQSISEKKYVKKITQAFDASFIDIAKDEMMRQEQLLAQMETQVADLLS